MSALVAIWASVAALFSIVARMRLRSLRHDPSVRSDRACVVLRPVDNPSDAEIANLAAPHEAHWQEVILSPRAIRGIAHQHSDPRTPNRKVGHVSQALRELGDVHVLVIDADVAISTALVEALVGALESGAAMAFAAPRALASDGFAARAMSAVFFGSPHDFRLLFAMSAGAPALCGKAIALGPAARTLWPQLADYAGEDLELASRLHASRERVVRVEVPATVIISATLRWSEAHARLLRWMRVLRAHRPALYLTVPLVIAATPFVLLGAAWAPLFALALVVTRGVVATSLGARPLDALLAEAIIAGAWLHSLIDSDLVWRGRRFRLAKGGVMRAVS